MPIVSTRAIALLIAVHSAPASVPDPLHDASVFGEDGSLEFAPSRAEQATLASFAAALDAARNGRNEQALEALERSLQTAAAVEDDAIRHQIERRILFEQARIRLSMPDLTAQHLRSIEQSLVALTRDDASFSQQAAAREVLEDVRARLRRFTGAPPPRLLSGTVQLTRSSVVIRKPPRLIVAGASVAATSVLGVATVVIGAVLERKVVNDYVNSPDRSIEASHRDLRAARTVVAVGVVTASTLLVAGLTALAVGIARHRRN